MTTSALKCVYLGLHLRFHTDSNRILMSSTVCRQLAVSLLGDYVLLQ